MTNLNPAGSYQRLIDARTNERGFCLVAVGDAILQSSPVLQGATTARDAWNKAGQAHQHATHAPRDYPMFISGAQNNDWDVAIASGDGVNCSASDYTDAHGVTHWGETGEMTIADRCRQVGGTLQGWTDQFLGYMLDGTSIEGGDGTSFPSTPIVIPDTQGDTMRIAYETLNADGNHYVAHLIHDDGYVVDSIDNQQGWNGVLPFVPNPIYVIYVNLFDPRQGNINPVLTETQWQALVARIASNWMKPANGGSVTVNGVSAADLAAAVAPISNAMVALATALGTDTAAIEAAIAGIPSATVKAEGAALSKSA